MKSAILFLLIFVTAPNRVVVTTYYIVRHAEKLNATADTPLSVTGQKRAVALRKYLKSKGVDSIFTSSFLRTQQTAQPLATLLGKTLRIHNGSTENLIIDLKRISDKEILVVGHSNTVPDIVKGLSGRTVPAIEENDFDNMYIVRVKTSPGTVPIRTMTRVTYGALSP